MRAATSAKPSRQRSTGQARIEYGESYKGEWSAGAYLVGEVVYHDGIFYECDAARAARRDTDDPATDTTGWSPKASSEGGITQAVQNAIDAQAVINFGDKYEGVWAVGAYAIGDVVYFHGDFRGASFYECTQTRTASNTSDPSVNASAWDVKTVTFEIMGDVNVDLTSVVNAIQNAIDAQGTANFGENYEGSWGAGIFAVDRVVYHDGAFYTCIVARAATDTDDPSVDTDSWAVEVSESGGLDAAIQNAIDAQGAIQFGSDYKGAWEAGIFAVGDDVYHDGVFYECDVARDAADTDDPATDTGSWSVKTVETSDASSAVQVAIDAQARIEYGDSYKGTWAAGAYAVGDVAYHDGVFYECDVARSRGGHRRSRSRHNRLVPQGFVGGRDHPSGPERYRRPSGHQFWRGLQGNVGSRDLCRGERRLSRRVLLRMRHGPHGDSNTDDNPATDTASWSPKVSIESDISDVKTEVDQARADIGGVDTKVDETRLDIGEVETKVDQARTDIGDVDTKVDQAISDISNIGVSQAVQNAINAQATASYGGSYKGAWAAGCLRRGERRLLRRGILYLRHGPLRRPTRTIQKLTRRVGRSR